MPVRAEDGKTDVPGVFRQVAGNIFRPLDCETIWRYQEVFEHKIVHLRFIIEAVGVEVQEVAVSPVNCKQVVAGAGQRLCDVPGARQPAHKGSFSRAQFSFQSQRFVFGKNRRQLFGKLFGFLRGPGDYPSAQLI